MGTYITMRRSLTCLRMPSVVGMYVLVADCRSVANYRNNTDVFVRLIDKWKYAPAGPTGGRNADLDRRLAPV